jgi:hypothetical protein
MKLDDIFRNLKFNVQSFFELKREEYFFGFEFIIIVLINIAAAYFPLRIDLTKIKFILYHKQVRILFQTFPRD